MLVAEAGKQKLSRNCGPSRGDNVIYGSVYIYGSECTEGPLHGHGDGKGEENPEDGVDEKHESNHCQGEGKVRCRSV